MATLVTFHAHPDDEAIATGGTMAKAEAEGHRVVLVVATRGERGEVPDGFLEPGETLADRRVRETLRAAEILGVHRVEFLGYVDSGMMDDPANADPHNFWNADLDEAAGRLAAILTDERAEVLTIYDANGGYGHPDHMKVHQVGLRAAEIAGTPRVYEATMNRDHFRRLLAAARDAELDLPEIPDAPQEDGFGVPEDTITTTVDVHAFLEAKRRAMAAHASQIGESSIFLAMPPPVFELAWRYEWFILRGAPETLRETSVFG